MMWSPCWTINQYYRYLKLFYRLLPNPSHFNYVPSSLKNASTRPSAIWTHFYGPAASPLYGFSFWPWFSRKGNLKTVQTHTLPIRTWHAAVLVLVHHTFADVKAQSTSDTTTATHGNTWMHYVYQEGWCLNPRESQVHQCWLMPFRSANSALK